MGAQESLKGLADDLVSTRLQNESLRAEMELQRKAFVVSVNWAARHAEMKTKTDEVQQDIENIHVHMSKAKEDNEAVRRSEEECRALREVATRDLEAARVELRALQEQLGDVSLHHDEDFATKKSEMEELKVQIAKQAEQEKKNKQKTRAAMEKSLLAGDQGLLMAVTQCWRDLTKELKLNKAKKEQSQGLAMRGIANSGTALLDFCLTAWYKILQEALVVKAQAEKAAKEDAQGGGAKHANKKVLAQLEKQFGEQSKGLLREVIHGWVEVRKSRLKREKAKSVAGRSIAGQGQALISVSFTGWFKLYDENKEKRKRKAASHAKGMRMIANGENALLDFCLTQWHELAKTAGNSKRAKQSANEKAVRLIAGRGTTMQKQVLHEWYVRVVKAREQK